MHHVSVNVTYLTHVITWSVISLALDYFDFYQMPLVIVVREVRPHANLLCVFDSVNV